MAEGRLLTETGSPPLLKGPAVGVGGAVCGRGWAECRCPDPLPPPPLLSTACARAPPLLRCRRRGGAWIAHDAEEVASSVKGLAAAVCAPSEVEASLVCVCVGGGKLEAECGERAPDMPSASASSDMIRWSRVLLSHTLDGPTRWTGHLPTESRWCGGAGITEWALVRGRFLPRTCFPARR